MDDRGETDSAYRYGAFISYRHGQPDERWAKWLHRKLETWRTPQPLVRSHGVPARIGRVFRDEEELAASAHLSAEIERALGESAHLVIVCSPRTPESRWVTGEVERFIQLGRRERILPLLIEGEPADTFPPPLLRGASRGTDDDGAPALADEPLAADVRPLPGESRAARRRTALLRIVAALLGCRFDDLRRRDAERRTRRLALAGAALTAVAVLLGILAAYAFRQRSIAEGALVEAQEQRTEAEKQRAEAEKQRAEAEKQRAEAEKQRAAAVAERQTAEERRLEADAQRKIADIQRGLADDAREEERAARNRAEELTEFMLFDLRDRLEVLGRTDLLREVARRTVAYYETRDPARLPPDERRRYEAALTNLGNVMKDQGELDASLATARRSLAVTRTLVEECPDCWLYHRDLGISHGNIGDRLEAMGRLHEAEAEYRERLRICTWLVEKEVDLAKDLPRLVSALRDVADVRVAQGDSTEAAGFYRRAHDLTLQITGEDPQALPDMERLARSYYGLARVGTTTETLAEQLVLARRALALRERLVEAEPWNRPYRRSLLRSREQVGLVLAVLGRGEEGLAQLQLAVGLAQEWMREDPRETWAADALLDTQTELGVVFTLLGNAEEGLAQYEAALKTSADLLRRDPKRADVLRARASAQGGVGFAELFRGNFVRARDVAQQALETLAQMPAEGWRARAAQAQARGLWLIASPLAGASPATLVPQAEAALEDARALRRIDSPQPIVRMATMLATFAGGFVLSSVNRADEALAAYAEEIPRLEESLRTDDGNGLWHYGLQQMEMGTGVAERAKGRTAAAVQHLQAALRHGHAMYAGLGRATLFAIPLATNLLVLADCLDDLDRRAEARDAYRDARALLETVVQGDASAVVAVKLLEMACDGEGEALRALDDHAGALLAFRRSLEVARDLQARDPADASATWDLVLSYENVGDEALATSAWVESRTAYEAELALLASTAGGAGSSVSTRVLKRRAWVHERLAKALDALGESRAAEIQRTLGEEAASRLPDR